MNHIEKQLRQYEINKLAEWFDIFNSWEFPKDFPFPKPERFDTDALWYSENNPYLEENLPNTELYNALV